MPKLFPNSSVKNGWCPNLGIFAFKVLNNWIWNAVLVMWSSPLIMSVMFSSISELISIYIFMTSNMFNKISFKFLKFYKPMNGNREFMLACEPIVILHILEAYMII